MDRIIVLDVGAVQFRAIFSYLSIYKKNLENIMNKKNLPDYQAKKELETKLRNREIYLANPEYTFCNMISGYANKLKINLEDTVIAAQDYGSWRKKISKEYKSQRRSYLIDTVMASLHLQESDAEQWMQKQYDAFNNLYLKLDLALPYHWIKKFSCEADDIGSVCCRYFTNKEIILVTIDKDWEMLCSFPNVKIFSPLQNKKTKIAKFKDVLNPTMVLLDKIRGDVSDNLLDKPSSDAEFEKRKKIVDLINPLPEFVEQPIKEELSKIMPKNFYPNKIPFKGIADKFIKLYKLNE
jgi:hypothetical protein